MTILQGKAKYPVVEVILHCPAVGKKWHVGKTVKQMRDAIDHMHRTRKPTPFKKIGYHLVVAPDGSIAQGREFTEIGAGVVERNRGVIHICMVESQTITKIGKFEDYFTEMQRVAVRKAIKALPGIKWVTGHNDYANKLCPGFKVEDGDWL